MEDFAMFNKDTVPANPTEGVVDSHKVIAADPKTNTETNAVEGRD